MLKFSRMFLPTFAKPVLCCRFFLYFLCGGCILFCLIFNELETILKIITKYFEKSLQLSKVCVSLYR